MVTRLKSGKLWQNEAEQELFRVAPCCRKILHPFKTSLATLKTPLPLVLRTKSLLAGAPRAEKPRHICRKTLHLPVFLSLPLSLRNIKIMILIYFLVVTD